MKVLHICANTNPGGITTFVRSLASPGRAPGGRHDIGVAIGDAPVGGTPESALVPLTNGFRNPLKALRNAKRAARDYHAIAFHTLSPGAVLPFLTVKSRYLVFQHGMNLGRGPAVKKAWLSVAPVLLRAKVVHSTPYAVEKARARGIRIAAKRSVIIPFGTALARRTSLPERILRTGDEIIVGTAGRLDKDKRFGDLLDSIRDYGGTTRLHLRIAGDGPELPSLTALAAQLPADRVRVEFAGIVGDMAAFYDGLDLFVFPARCESFGLVVLEALVRSVPVAVFSDVGGALALVRDRENGFRLEPGTGSLRGLWRELDRDPGILRNLALNAAGMGLDEYDIARTKARLEMLIPGGDRKDNPKRA
jgi:glycosyltransferase involved in cell wall biosynthesis